MLSLCVHSVERSGISDDTFTVLTSEVALSLFFNLWRNYNGSWKGTVRSHIPNSVSLNKTNTLLNFFLHLFCTCHSVLKNLMLRPSWCVRVRVKIAKCNFFFERSPYHQRSTPNRSPMNCLLWFSVRRNNYSPVNGLAENDNARIHNGRFLKQVLVRTVVFQHSIGERVSLYSLRNEIYVQENVFFVSSLLDPCIKREF